MTPSTRTLKIDLSSELQALSYQIRLKTYMLFAQKNEKLGKGKSHVPLCRRPKKT